MDGSWWLPEYIKSQIFLFDFIVIFKVSYVAPVDVVVIFRVKTILSSGLLYTFVNDENELKSFSHAARLQFHALSKNREEERNMC